MIKAEVIKRLPVSEHLAVDQVNFEAKGSHHDLVTELRSIIDTFNEQESYHLELMAIIKSVLEQNLDNGLKELDKLKKENK